MALRRKLPSRMTSETPSDSAAAPKVAVPVPAPAPREETSVAAPLPETSLPPQADALAAAAAEAFGTVPEAAPKPRVLEESFTAPVAAAPLPSHDTLAEPAFVAPAWQEPQESTTFVAPAWETADVPSVAAMEPEVSAPAWDAPVAEPQTSEVTAAEPEHLPAWQLPPQPEPDFAPKPEPEPQVQPEIPAAPQPEMSPDVPVAAPQPAESAAFAAGTDIPQVVGMAPAGEEEGEVAAAEDTPQGPTSFTFEPSRPDTSRMRRRVREKRARDFSAMGSAEDAKPPRPQAVTDAFAPTVPVDTRPLDEVDDALIASGVMAPRPGDSLTSHLPGGVAESTQRLEPLAPPAPPEALPAPLPVVTPQPAPASQEPAPQDAAPQAPAPVVPPQPEESLPRPAFTLSNAAPLPAPQSDLPWVQPQTAPEWDIGTPDNQEWAQHTPETASEPAMHMPPQTDLYKPMGATMGSSAPQLPGGIPSPSATPSFTPELPGQRRKAQGTPWALVAVGLVVVAAAGAYLMTSGKQGATATLANLTNRTATGNEEQPLLPPPDAATGGSGSFMAALPPAVEGSADTSGSAMVAFADVPAGEANQPIVAEGNEEMPKGFLSQLHEEVEKARARKEGDTGEGEAALGATATAPAAAESAYTQEDLKKELEAYRTALSSSANPSELKPGSFEAGKTAQTDAELASGSLLPPPAALPPAELYTNNPNNLPVVAEPVTNAPERVRTLADFPDVEAYMPEREKVEVPANIKPKLAATDFPALEVLSFVPGQGVVAFADGREGVLLIGETINGWELVAVSADNAEFKAGQKSYQVTSQN